MHIIQAFPVIPICSFDSGHWTGLYYLVHAPLGFSGSLYSVWVHSIVGDSNYFNSIYYATLYTYGQFLIIHASVLGCWLPQWGSNTDRLSSTDGVNGLPQAWDLWLRLFHCTFQTTPFLDCEPLLWPHTELALRHCALPSRFGDFSSTF